MKLMSNIARKMLPVEEPKVVEMIAAVGGWRQLPNPTMSDTLKCLICDGTAHYTPHIDPSKDVRRVWICANGDCETNKRLNNVSSTYIPPNVKRACEWPLFCELNCIGDIHHDVRFESIKQSSGKLDYLLKFANKPSGIIFMQGSPGTGKTYASMAVCELYTRKNHACIFTTQEQMFKNWLDTFDRFTNYIERVEKTGLLVVDDFGTGDVSEKFMKFFMSLINTRIQWKERGTIITTNLNNKRFNEVCGEALSDRIATGQRFEFNGETRRHAPSL